MDDRTEETRIALIGIIIENPLSIDRLNKILHEYAEFVVGRMGIPYRPKHVNIISIVIDAPADRISALCGKLGMLDGINVKTVYTKQEN